MKQQAELIAAVLAASQDRWPHIVAACRDAEQHRRMGGVKEAAAILGTCTRTAERYAKQGLIPRVHLSPRCVRFDLSAVKRFAEQGRPESAAKAKG